MRILSIPTPELKDCVVARPNLSFMKIGSGRVGKIGRERVRDTRNGNSMHPNTTLVTIPCLCRASLRRRIIVPDDDDDDDEDEENRTLVRLEAYTEAVRSEVLLVHALVDDQPDQVIIFKGFSSSLVRRTSPDPSKPVLPSRAIIKSIDRIRGPFNPSNIDYIQKDLKWEEFEELLKEKQL